jgi:hypothetical protein
MEMSDGAPIPASPPLSTDGNNNHVTPDGNKNGIDGGSTTGGAVVMDYIDQPVKDPHAHDVLCGRGGNINSHPGNERFRTLVDKRKRVYLTARFKREKRLIASSIVSEIRTLKPAGRFLSQDKKSGLWKDIGDEKARDKTSQALRENAPTIRAKIETETNEQRGEMKKDDDPKVGAPNTHHAQHAAPPPPPHHHAPPFYGGWGPYPYYGYAQHPPPQPPPPQPQIRYYPPPSEQPPTPSEQPAIWGSFYPPPPAASASASAATKPQAKSAIEQTADYITSGAESIKSWTRASLSFGGDGSISGTASIHTADNDHHGDGNSTIASAVSKPLSYVHQDDSKKRRIVKFRSDTKRLTSRRRMGSVTGQLPPAYPPPDSSNNSTTHSLLADDNGDDSQEGHGNEMEPHNLDEEQNNSLMTQVANQILGSIGSWDAGSILCGTDNSDRHDAPFPRHHHRHHHSSSASHASASAAAMMAGGGGGALADELEDDMAVEWEGQEVQLLDPRSAPDCATSVASEDRMPPPSRGGNSAFHEQTSVGAFSSLGSCHSWMPEQFGSVGSFFGAASSRSGGGGGESMDMDHYSAVHSAGGGTENYSAAGSLGGNSLIRAFDAEASLPDHHSSSQQQYDRNLSQVPSWDRSFRSRSPLSIESSDDDESLMSKDDTTVSGKPEMGGGGGNISVSPVTQSTTPPETDDFGGMAWETRE